MILAISVAVSIGAQGSLPGEPLYPIKTEINETVEHWLAISAASETELSAKLARRRLEEAEQLKAKGKLDTESKALLAQEFVKESERTGAVLGAELKSALRERGDILNLGANADVGAEIKVDTSATFRKSFRTIAGEMFLTFENGKIILTGSLKRANPCIKWQTEVTSSQDISGPNAAFKINQHSTADICIQVLGEPQEIKAETPAAPDAEITVTLESKVVFSGKIK